MSNLNRYQVSKTAEYAMMRVAREFGDSFVPRAEPAMVLTSDREFYSARLQVTSVDLVIRPGSKLIDVCLTFDVTAVADPHDSSIVLVEEKVVAPPSVHHLPHNPNPAGPNKLNLGQLGHYGDVEILRSGPIRVKLLQYVMHVNAITKL